MKKKKRRKKKPNVWRSDRSTKLTQSLPYDTGISFVLTSSFSTHFGVMGKKNENFHELKKNFFRFTRSIVVKVKCVHIHTFISLSFFSLLSTHTSPHLRRNNKPFSLSLSFLHFSFQTAKVHWARVLLFECHQLNHLRELHRKLWKPLAIAVANCTPSTPHRFDYYLEEKKSGEREILGVV